MSTSPLLWPLNSLYRPLELIVQSQRGEVWRVADGVGGQWVVKLSVAGFRPDEALIAALSERPNAHLHLALPSSSGYTDDGRYFSIFTYYPLRALNAQLRLNQFDQAARALACRIFLEQIAAALEIIHQPDGSGRPIIHGDLKPSNILVGSDAHGAPMYLLADLDCAHFAGSHNYRFTYRYAAPEVIGGSRGVAADYWSLGMTLLEWLLGEHPFSDIGDQAIRTQLVTNWVPDLGRVDDEAWRALLYGLLERSPETRWGGGDIRRWLDGDLEIISLGLARGGESRSAEALDVNGTPVHSAKGLAGALIRNWVTDLVSDPNLSDWLRDQLHRPDIAALANALRTDASLTDDIRLLRLSFSLDPTIPPTWRRRSIDRKNLDNIAGGALGGNVEDLDWLRSLLDGTCRRFYETRDDRRTYQLLAGLEDAWNEFQAIRNTLASAGTAEQLLPRDELFMPMVARTCFSTEMRDELNRYRENVRIAPLLLMGESWIRSLGSVSTLSMVQLLVLRHFLSAPVLARDLGLESIFTRDLTIESIFQATERNPSMHEGALIQDGAQRKIQSKFGDAGNVEVITLEPGNSYPRHGAALLARNWDEIRTAITAAIRRLLRSMRRIILTRMGRPPPTEENIRADFRLRMIEVAHADLAKIDAFEPTGKAYLALISWHAPGFRHVRITIADMGGLLPSGRIITPNLPSRGGYLILLTGNSRVNLWLRRRYFSIGWRTLPISVWFDPISQPDAVANQLEKLTVQEAIADKLAETTVLTELKADIVLPSEHLEEIQIIDPALSEPEFWRKQLARPSRKPTIAERIRAMNSDEHLHAFANRVEP